MVISLRWGRRRVRGGDAWKNVQEAFPHLCIFHCTVFCIKSSTECCCMNYLRIYQPHCEDFDRGHPIVLIVTVGLYTVKPSNTTYKIYWLKLNGRLVSVSNDHLQALYNNKLSKSWLYLKMHMLVLYQHMPLL